MTVNHASLTDPELHEPKGASTASSGQVYAANGAGSGAWAKPFKYVSVASSYSTGAPYVHATTTSDTVLNPTVSTVVSSQFTVQTVPNFRLRYDGAESLIAKITFNCSFRQTDGADRNVQWVIFRNGSQINSSRIIATTESGKWVNATVIYDATLATNDYIEIFSQAVSAFNSDYAKIYVSIEGHVV